MLAKGHNQALWWVDLSKNALARHAAAKYRSSHFHVEQSSALLLGLEFRPRIRNLEIQLLAKDEEEEVSGSMAERLPGSSHRSHVGVACGTRQVPAFVQLRLDNLTKLWKKAMSLGLTWLMEGKQ